MAWNVKLAAPIAGNQQIAVGLYNRKANLGGLCRPVGYEIAFSEYAMALGYEMTKDDPDMPADDLLYEVRSSLNRVAGAAIGLYRD